MPVVKAQMDQLISSPNSNEFYNSISHLLGCVLSIAGTIVLVVLAALEHKWLLTIGFSIYGLTLFLSLLSSTLLHFNLLFNRYYRSLGIFDHAAIYTLIAGTYTPFMLTLMEPVWGWTLLGIIWCLAILFVTLKALFFTTMPKMVSTGSYLLLGWVGMVVMYHLYTKIGAIPLIVMLVGGFSYSIGSIIFTYNKMDLFPPYFGTHEIWHTAVLIGHLSMYLIALLYLLPFPA
jgi:hemolysin III